MKLATIRIPGSYEDEVVHVAVESFENGAGRGRLVPDLWTFSTDAAGPGGAASPANAGEAGTAGDAAGPGGAGSPANAGEAGTASAASATGAASPAGPATHTAGAPDLSVYPVVEFTEADLLPVVPNPGKVFCVGLNYREHIEEMGHPIPDHPTLFVKYADAITGPFDNVLIPRHMAAKPDYEGELAIIMGPFGQIAGYSIMNDFSQRDWQYRTQQWLQGKNLVKSSGFGPWMVTPDECDPVRDASMLRTWVNGELRQEHSVADLVFKPQELVDYIQNFIPLEAGDVIVSGTPEGVGHGMKPARYIADGDEVRIAIDGIGEIRNTFSVV